jgi:hypothetical protein
MVLIMKKTLIIIIFIFLISSFNLTPLNEKSNIAKAEKAINLEISSNVVTWMKIISKFNQIERGDSVQQTNDGGYIINGFYAKDWLSDHIMWLIKTDENGNIQWYKEYEDIHGAFVQQTNDNGYIIIDYYEVSLVKTDGNGNIQWKKTFGHGKDRAYFGRQTNDGGYILTGKYTQNDKLDLWVIKTDENGNLEWQKSTGSDDDEDLGIFVSQTKDDGYIIVGKRGGLSIWLLKLSSSGNIEWDNTFSGNPNHTVEPSSVQQTADGGYIIFGNKLDDGKRTDFWLIKTDELGNMIWNYTYGDDKEEICYSGQQTDDNGFIMLGTLTIKDCDNKDIILIKTDENGNLVWEKTFGTECFEIGLYIQQTQDGGYIFTGFTDTSLPGEGKDEDLLLIKTNEYGEFIASPKYPYRIDGQINCKPGNEYTYITKSLHWEDKKMRFGWDWDGDNVVDEWTEEYYENYENCSYNHSWGTEGMHSVKAIAEDKDGVQSGWSEPLTISVSKSKLKNQIRSNFLSNFLKNHPLLLSILKQMLS